MDVNGTRDFVGGLVAWNRGSVTGSCSTGSVSGSYVGGLVGANYGIVIDSYSACMATGGFVGGLVGYNGCTDWWDPAPIGDDSGSGPVGSGLLGARIVTSCSSGLVIGGGWYAGGLVGYNAGSIADSYSRSPVSGYSWTGGLVGCNNGSISSSYSRGPVLGWTGGLVGSGESGIWGPWWGSITSSFWDIQTSGLEDSRDPNGLTTAEMQTASTFLAAGWDFVGETANGTNDVWKIVEGLTYPLLSWQKYSGGTGEPNDPYQIATAADLIALGEDPNDYDKHFVLIADIDLDPNLPGRRVFDRAVIAPDVWAAELSWYQGFTFFFHRLLRRQSPCDQKSPHTGRHTPT